MKKNILFVFIGAMLIFAACEPIEKRQDMGAVLPESELDITVTIDGNYVNLVNNTGKVLPYWSWSGGHANTNTAKAHFPLANSYKITFTAYCAGGAVSTTRDVKILKNDEEFYKNPFWKNLTNGATGKTWVWAADISGEKVWGNGGYLGSKSPGWWTLSVDDIKGQGGDPGDEITFDLNQAHNVAVKMLNANPKPSSGKGNFNMAITDKDIVYTDDKKTTIWSYGKMNFTGQTIPLGFQVNSKLSTKPYVYSFDILKLTENELVLAFPHPDPETGKMPGAWGEAWFFMFKAKGYKY